MNDIGSPVPNGPPEASEKYAKSQKAEASAARRWGARIVGSVALLLLGGGLALGALRYQAQQREVLASAAQSQALVPTVRTATVKPSDGTILVTLPATTSAFSTANVFARASGYVDKRNVDIGDHVKKGDLLAEITAPELDQQIAQAGATLAQTGASLRQAQANRDLANVTWGRDKPLVQQGWVTKQQGDVDSQTLAAQDAQVGVAQANFSAQQAQLKVLQQQKDYQSVVAPFDGVITQRNIDVGTLVQADTTSGTFMFTVMQTDIIRVQVYVPQDQAFGVAPGVEAVVRVPEIPDRGFRGKVTRIADALEPTTRTLLTEIDVPNPDGALSPGIYCSVELHIPRKTPSLVVPADAIVFDAEGLHVAVVKDGVLHMENITIARDFGTEVEVVDGLNAGDQVILNPSTNLVEGSKVQTHAPLTVSSKTN
jgi:RND family efflux transporter MFP subunit